MDSPNQGQNPVQTCFVFLSSVCVYKFVLLESLFGLDCPSFNHVHSSIKGSLAAQKKILNTSATHHPIGSKVCAKLTHLEMQSAESYICPGLKTIKQLSLELLCKLWPASIYPINAMKEPSSLSSQSNPLPISIITILIILSKGFRDKGFAAIS